MKLVSKLLQRLNPPPFSTEKESRKASTLFLIIKASFIGISVILGVRIMGAESEFYLIPPLLASLGLLLFSHFLLLSKRLEPASYTLVGTFLGLCCYLVIVGGNGYHDTALFAVPGLLIVAGMVLRKKQFYIFTLVPLLLIALLVVVENLGIYETKFSHLVSPYDGIDIIVVIAITALSVRILTDNLVRSLQRAKRNEKALQESEDKYRNLVQYAPTGIYEFDMENLEFISVNDVMCEYTGYSKEEFLRLNPFDILSDDSKTTLENLINTVFSENPEELAAEYKIKGKNQREFWVLSNAKFFYEAGVPKRAMAVVHDLTDIRQSEEERHKLETQLYQARKMEAIGTLAGGIAHDFNNILSGIIGYSQLAKNHVDNPQKAIRSIDQSLKGAKRAAELVQQILTFSRKTEYQKKPLCISFEINEALKLLRSTIPSTIDIVKNLNSESMISADPGKIHQLVMNLCTNAYHAMKERGGRLTVILTEVDILGPKQSQNGDILPGKYVKLEVSDTGHGMGEKEIEKAFDPYYTTKQMGEGTGFGLAIVQAVVDEHDGHIEVKSDPGKGTRFYIYFPIVTKDVEPADSSMEGPASLTGSERIMFVDDERPIREIAKESLENLGYEVDLSRNGFEALQAVKEDTSRFDLIVTDMNMPVMAGDVLTAELKSLNPDIPIIMCTGFGDTMTEEKAAALGISAYLGKPVEMVDLCQKMRQVLDEKR
ncbi:MAG: response regulator [Desulfobacter sp.]|nr:MAG: response regulator [Desulfobacter sp.]